MSLMMNLVTPFVGVWIETGHAQTGHSARRIGYYVTPFVGVWIETTLKDAYKVNGVVTPFVGVWIETHH